MANKVFGAFSGVGVATGANWPDSLSGGALMGRVVGPLLLVNPAYGLSPLEYTLFDKNRGSDNYGHVFGGPAVLPNRIDNQVAAAIDTATGSVRDTGHGTRADLSTPSLGQY